MSSQYLQSSNPSFLEVKPILLISPPLSPNPLAAEDTTQSNESDESDNNSLDNNSLDNNSLDKNSLDKNSLDKNSLERELKLNNHQQKEEDDGIIHNLQHINLPKIIVTQEPQKDSTNSSLPISRNKYRMRICEIPPEILTLIKASQVKNTISSKNKKSSTAVSSITGELPAFPENMGCTNDKNSSSFATSNQFSSHNKGRVIITPNNPNNTTTKTTTTTTQQTTNSHKIISDKKNRSRKNPYPKKAPSKSSPGITLKVDVFTPYKEDPASLLKRNDPPTITNSSNSLLFNEFSSSDSSPPNSPRPNNNNRQRKTKTKRSKNNISERKRKGNSLARVMADRGLLETTFNPVTTVTSEIKPIRIPPPPPMQFDDLIKSIDQLGLTTDLLNKVNPRINWKGQPLSILHLPNYNFLHPKEAIVASTLRLTPVQYLTAKNTLVSSARRYIQKSLPFRKSDAQKLLRIDVNKASKLWEFFMQVKWI